MYDPDQHIIDGLIKGDQKAYKKLFDSYYLPLCVYSMKFVNSFEDAEDIVQEFFVNFWKNRIFERIKTRLKTYLFAAVRNNSINYLKKNDNLYYRSLDDFEIEFEEVDVEELKLLQSRLKKEIDALPPKSRQVFIEIVLNDLKYKEAADKIGISVNTVKTQLARALKKLRSSFDTIILLLISK